MRRQIPKNVIQYSIILKTETDIHTMWSALKTNLLIQLTLLWQHLDLWKAYALTFIGQFIRYSAYQISQLKVHWSDCEICGLTKLWIEKRLSDWIGSSMSRIIKSAWGQIKNYMWKWPSTFLSAMLLTVNLPQSLALMRFAPKWKFCLDSTAVTAQRL